MLVLPIIALKELHINNKIQKYIYKNKNNTIKIS